MVLSDDFVLLQVPALDLLVLASGEEVRMTIRDNKPPHRVDVSCEGYLKLACGQIPELYGSVVAARDEKLIHWVDSQAADPTVVTSNDSL